MLVNLYYENETYEVSLYRDLRSLRLGTHRIKSVEYIDGFLVVDFTGYQEKKFKVKTKVGKKRFHVNRLSGRLLTSLGYPKEVSPSGFGIRYMQVKKLRFEVIEVDRMWEGLKEEDVRNI